MKKSFRLIISAILIGIILSNSFLVLDQGIIDTELQQDGIETYGVVSSSSSYDPQAAINYAELWWDGRNSDYNDYSNSGGDCANFVSQCLIAGGLDLSAGPGVDDKGCIPSVKNLEYNLINSQNTMYQVGGSEPLWVVEGDPILFYSYDGNYHHSAFGVVGDEYNYWLGNAHSLDCNHKLISWFLSDPNLDYCVYFHINENINEDVTLTLYIHENSPSGAVLSGVQVTGYDADGNNFAEITGFEGYVIITGTPGTWHFEASKSGYETNIWDQEITETVRKDGYLTSDINQPPVADIKLRQNGNEITGVNVNEWFDIYVGGSTDDTGIERVRFMSDESQNGITEGSWTSWYNWDTSSGDWNAGTKIMKWLFTTPGEKEVWVEVEDIAGLSSLNSAGIWASVQPEINNPPNLPSSLFQLESDGVTQISEGGTTNEDTVVFKAYVSDPDNDDVYLEIELRQIGESFTGNPTSETIGGPYPSGTTIEITRSWLNNAQYHWQYRSRDSNGEYSNWVEYGISGNVDFTVDVSTNIAPNIPSSVLQLKSDNVTQISEGGTTNEDTVVFKAYVSDPDNDDVYLEIELRQIGESFTGIPTSETIGGPYPSGTTIEITRSWLNNAQYHWQYRSRDSHGEYSNWVEYGISGNVDFIIASEIDCTDFDNFGQALLYSIIGELEDYFQTSFIQIPIGSYGNLNLKFKIDPIIGIKFVIEVDLSISVTSNDILLNIKADFSIEEEIPEFYGIFYTINDLFSKLDALKLNIEHGGGVNFEIEAKYDKTTRDWEIIKYGGAIQYYFRVSYDYLKLLIFAFAPTYAPLYDLTDEICQYLTGVSIAETVNGYLEFDIRIVLNYDVENKETSVILTPSFSLIGFSVDINNDWNADFGLGITFTGFIRCYANPTERAITGEIQVTVEILANLYDLITSIPFFGNIIDKLANFGLNELNYELEIVVCNIPLFTILLWQNPSFIDSDGDGISDYDEENGVYGYDTNKNDADTDNDGLTDGEEILIYRTNPLEIDTDGDGLSDYSEVYGEVYDFYNDIQIYFEPTNPLEYDTDNDLLYDSEEILGWIWDFELGEWIYNVFYPTDPHNEDSDNDGFSDAWEVLWYFTSPTDYNDVPLDSDGDGLYDIDEIFYYGTNEYESDSDFDSLNDYDELSIGTDPNIPDTDGDGLIDGEEIYLYSTDPLLSDTDSDGLTDGDEINQYSTDPLSSDTDGDGLTDGDEINNYGTNPTKNDTDDDGLTDPDELNIYNTDPLSSDTDSDGLTDGDEINQYSTDPLLSDTDGDGLTDGDEINIYGTNPTKNDTDDDGLTDPDELNIYNTDPLSSDTDNDGLTDGDEINQYSTDPLSSDTDNDGLTDGDEINIYGTNPTTNDTDSDGLTDGDEINIYGTNPKTNDTDGDGLTDPDELNIYNTDPLSSDTDGDGLTDGDEINQYSTDPLSSDTDGDGLSDGDEINQYSTDPLLSDTDNDGLTDGDEINQYSTDPLSSDTDSDGLTDVDEINIYGTNPTTNDTDDDGLTDPDELNIFNTDPLSSDTDGDGLTDGDEITLYSTDPLLIDTDNDGLPDGWEVQMNLDPNNQNDSEIDNDNDGLSNFEEFSHGTNPNNADTDSDLLTDYDEIFTHNTDPNNADTDGDLLSDYDEIFTHNTDPNNADTDGDLLSDYDEIFAHGTDPNNADTDGDLLSDYDEIMEYQTNANNNDTDGDSLSDYDEIFTHNTDPNDDDSDDDGFSDGLEVEEGTDPNDPDDPFTSISSFSMSLIGINLLIAIGIAILLTKRVKNRS